MRKLFVFLSFSHAQILLTGAGEPHHLVTALNPILQLENVRQIRQLTKHPMDSGNAFGNTWSGAGAGAAAPSSFAPVAPMSPG